MPDARAKPCPHCDGGEGPSGQIVVKWGKNWEEEETITCPECKGLRVIPAYRDDDTYYSET